MSCRPTESEAPGAEGGYQAQADITASSLYNDLFLKFGTLMLLLPKLLLGNRTYLGKANCHREVLRDYSAILLSYCQDKKFGISELSGRKDALGMGARIVGILRQTVIPNQGLYRVLQRPNTAWRDVLPHLHLHEPAVEREKAFLWSLVEAEAQFLKNFLNFESHEERVTGTLLSTLALTVESYGQLFYESTGAYSGPAMAVFDTATSSNERKTGSDFGVIVRSTYSGTKSLVKAARIQMKISKHLKVKIANTERQSDIDRGVPKDLLKYQQLKSLCSPDGVGYYCAIEASRLDEFSLSPIVFSAQPASTKLKENQDSIDIASDLKPLPLFAFLAIGMTSEKSGGHGVTADGADDELQLASAVQMLFAGNATPPRYCLYVDVTGNSLTPVFRNNFARYLAMKLPQPRSDQSGLQLRKRY